MPAVPRVCRSRHCCSGVLLSLELPYRVSGFIGCDSNLGINRPAIVVPAEKRGGPDLGRGIRFLLAALFVVALFRGFLSGVLEPFQWPPDFWRFDSPMSSDV